MNILVDTCFWYAYYDPRDEKHYIAKELIDYFEFGNIIIPYPTLYETINTRFSKHTEWIAPFNELIQNEKFKLIDDNDYREIALNQTFEYSIYNKRPISFVDMIIRMMLDDINLKIDAMITFNLEDFIDVCTSKNIEIISE